MDGTLHAIVQAGEIVSETGGATVVPWWSFTKTVISAAALTLVRDGSLELDQTLEGERYTLRHLLQHRAGLAEYGALPEYHAAVARGDKPWPVEELLRLTDAGRLRYEPGHGWGYSNIGYMKVAHLIERAADVPLNIVLAQRVFEPLRISGARLARTAADLTGVEMGSAASYDPGWVHHRLLVGPVSESALLLDRLLGGTLLPPPLIAEMLRAHPVDAVDADRPWRRPGYGLGVMLEAADGPVGHTGGGPGSGIAVYRSRNGTVPQTIAVFAPSESIGEVEHLAFEELRE